MSTFVNFDLDLHFERHMLQEFDDQTMRSFWRKLDENQLVSEMVNVFFCVFPVDTFSIWKMETKLYSNLHSCPTLCRTQVPWSQSATIFEFWTVSKKTDYICCTLHLQKLEKEANLWGKKINLYFFHSPNGRSIGILRLSVPVCEIHIVPTI